MSPVISNQQITMEARKAFPRFHAIMRKPLERQMLLEFVNMIGPMIDATERGTSPLSWLSQAYRADLALALRAMLIDLAPGGEVWPPLSHKRSPASRTLASVRILHYVEKEARKLLIKWPTERKTINV